MLTSIIIVTAIAVWIMTIIWVKACANAEVTQLKEAREHIGKLDIAHALGVTE